ncbi:hypothetical protein MNAN1_002514 [Malassezia nana]|uniref:Uncharacterized protein n=1 Tax=Malassezia nana TaxID=180528 RepID=A0AAF0J2Z8_9BASI|nr:hypothetical protein MNAN1_002514 [Malassezia nana]
MTAAAMILQCTRIPLLKYSRQVKEETGELRRWEHVSLQALVCCVSVAMSPTGVHTERYLTIEWNPCSGAQAYCAAPVRLEPFDLMRRGTACTEAPRIEVVYHEDRIGIRERKCDGLHVRACTDVRRLVSLLQDVCVCAPAEPSQLRTPPNTGPLEAVPATPPRPRESWTVEVWTPPPRRSPRLRAPLRRDD